MNKKIIIYGNFVNALSDEILSEAVRTALNLPMLVGIDIKRMRENEELELLQPTVSCNSYHNIMDMLLKRVYKFDTILMSPQFSIDKGSIDSWFINEVSKSIEPETEIYKKDTGL